MTADIGLTAADVSNYCVMDLQSATDRKRIEAERLALHFLIQTSQPKPPGMGQRDKASAAGHPECGQILDAL
jgi:hypothetical protein